MTYAPLMEHFRERQGIGEELNNPLSGMDSAAEIYAARGRAPEPAKPERQSVLTEAQGLVHGDRNEQYGAPIGEYTRTVGMVNSMLAHKLKEPLAPEDLAYIMVCLKLSRQINKPKRDSLVDAAGYCEVGQWIIDAKAGKP